MPSQPLTNEQRVINFAAPMLSCAVTIQFMGGIASSYPNAIHENFCECLDDGMLEWESLKWYLLPDASRLDYLVDDYIP